VRTSQCRVSQDRSEREHRSVANFIELLIRQHCEQVGISIPEQTELFEEAD